MITVCSFADLQAAILAGEPDINIGGVIAASGQTLNFTQPDGIANQRGMTVIGGGVLRCAGIVADGFRRLKFKEFELYTEGHGLIGRNGIQIYMEDVYTCCHGDSVRLESVAAYWGRGEQHTAAVPGQMTVAMRIGNSPQGYESVDSDALLVEGHMKVARIGGAGNNVNMWFRNTKADRPGGLVNGSPRNGSCVFHIGPSGTGNARNINIINPWINGADYPILLDVSSTTGRIDRVNIQGGEYLGCAHAPVTVTDPARVTYSLSGQQVIGPLEPGS